MHLEASILNTLPFSIYCIDPKQNILKGGNLFFINFLDKSLQDNFKEKSIEAIFKQEQLTLIRHLLKECARTSQPLSLCEEFYKEIKGQSQLVRVHCFSLCQENLILFVEILVPEKNQLQHLQEEKEKLASRYSHEKFWPS